MFCRFCGKSIPEDSEYCSYCGKAQGSTSQQAFTQLSTPIQSPSRTGTNISTLKTIASFCFYTGIIGFLILFTRMAPGIGRDQIIAYVIGTVITIVAAVIVHKIRNKAFTVKRQLVALVFGLLLLIPSIALRIVYESKVDAALADFSQSDTVCISMITDEEFYSPKGGYVYEPYSYITLGDNFGVLSRAERNQSYVIYVDLHKPYTAKISAGHRSDHGSTTETVIFTQSNLSQGHTFSKKVPLDDGYAIVTIEARRICPFWDVIFYSPD